MHKRLIIPCLALFLALVACAHEPEFNMFAHTTAQIDIDEEIYVTGKYLPNYRATGILKERKHIGPLEIQVRKGVYPDLMEGTNQPATIIVIYRDRIIAAAVGYRLGLGSELTENEIVIESWSGFDNCPFTRWRLEFTGEHMLLSSTETIRSPNCIK